MEFPIKKNKKKFKEAVEPIVDALSKVGINIEYYMAYKDALPRWYGRKKTQHHGLETTEEVEIDFFSDAGELVRIIVNDSIIIEDSSLKNEHTIARAISKAVMKVNPKEDLKIPKRSLEKMLDEVMPHNGSGEFVLLDDAGKMIGNISYDAMAKAKEELYLNDEAMKIAKV